MDLLKKYYPYVIGAIVALVVAIAIGSYLGYDKEVTEADLEMAEGLNYVEDSPEGVKNYYAGKKMTSISVVLTNALLLILGILVVIFSIKTAVENVKSFVRFIIPAGILILLLIICWFTAQPDNVVISTRAAYDMSDVQLAGMIVNCVWVLMVTGIVSLVGLGIFKAVKG